MCKGNFDSDDMIPYAIDYYHDTLLMSHTIIKASEVDISVKEGQSYHMYDFFESG